MYVVLPTLANPKIFAFLTHLPAKEKACASARNQALLTFFLLCRHVIGPEIIRARRPERLFDVSTGEEVEAALVNVTDDKRLMAPLIHDAGLRLTERPRLWVQHVGFARNEITVRSGRA